MPKATVTTFVSGQHWLALDVNVKDQDVYVNYCVNGEQWHVSRHASGQQHPKKGRDYVRWTGGVGGNWEPIKQAKPKPSDVENREYVSAIGWVIDKIPGVLPVVAMAGDFSVDATDLPCLYTLAFEVSIVGPKASERADVYGFPVLHRYRISGSVDVEIEAFFG